MDPMALVPLVAPLVAAVVDYLKGAAAHKAGAKAAEVVGEKTGAAVFDALRRRFADRSDAQAGQALALVAQDPDDEDYRQKLIKETARLAAAEPAFAAELEALAARFARGPQGGATFANYAPNYGAQAEEFNAPVTITNAIPRPPR